MPTSKGVTAETSYQSENASINQSYVLVWVDANIDENCHDVITQLERIVSTTKIFKNIQQCIDFITNTQDKQILIITSGTYGQKIVPIIHNLSQIDSIYIFCGDESKHKQWSKQWSKIKDVVTNVSSIYKALKQTIQQYDQNSISISFVSTNNNTSNKNLNQLDTPFMYTEILKEILLEIDFNEKLIKDFVTHCREHFKNKDQQEFINMFENNYQNYSPIWWYTCESFLYSMLNEALRVMNVEIIIKMGFFVRDLHEAIKKLHTEQYNSHSQSHIITVYRGQFLSKTAFDQMRKTPGGLLSFNSFLSTSEDRDVSLNFISGSHINSELIPILFVINIDTSISSAPFASIKDISSHEDKEAEILFSMHTVFRIGKIFQINDCNNDIWQVELTLTRDNDPELRALTEKIREETQPDEKGWFRLGELLIKLGHFDKAQQVCEEILHQASNDQQKADIHHQLGNIKVNQNQYEESIICYKKALQIYQKIHHPNHPDIAVSYNNIGLVYNKMGDCSKALSSHNKALEIRQKSLPPNHPHIASSYNEIGAVYIKTHDYSKALQYNEKALDIYKKSLPSNHPDLANSYNNIGSVYNKMNEYTKALACYDKALQIWTKSLPPNHPLLATAYTNMGIVHDKINQYSNALLYFEKVIEIRKALLPQNHPDLASSYERIGSIWSKMGDYSKASSYYKHAIEIGQQSLPDDHPHLQQWRKNFETVQSTF